MNRRNAIVLTTPELEVWGNFKRMCEAKGIPYHSVKMKKFPIIYGEYTIYRVPFIQSKNNSKNIDQPIAELK